MFAVVRTFARPLFLGALVLAHAVPARGDDSKDGSATHAVEDGGAPVPKEGSNAAVRASVQMAPPKNAGHALTVTTADGKTATCREQAAQPFLIRGNWFPSSKDPEVIKHGRKLLEDAIQYRTSTYGYFEGFGSRKANPHPPKFYAKPTTFMGLTVHVHEKIIPALKCVEAALKANGAVNEYKPRSAGGIRFKNTYRGVEVSNHVYGIAIDIEPDRNSCCGCVAPWPNHPLCKAKNKTVWERMAMPKSWVDTFERYGFYWLGHDVLQDTMHFEFLGDPEKILDVEKS